MYGSDMSHRAQRCASDFNHICKASMQKCYFLTHLMHRHPAWFFRTLFVFWKLEKCLCWGTEMMFFRVMRKLLITILYFIFWRWSFNVVPYFSLEADKLETIGSLHFLLFWYLEVIWYITKKTSHKPSYSQDISIPSEGYPTVVHSAQGWKD